MTVSQLVQLYAPLVGMLVLAFWVGGLSQRVKDQGEKIKELQRERDGDSLNSQRLTRIETLVEVTDDKIEKLTREITGIHRQLANLMVKGVGGAIIEFGG